MEERLDKILVDRALVTSRTRGEELIKNGDVLVNGKTIDKPGKKIALDAVIELINQELTWVSRGALKLLKGIEDFEFPVRDFTFIDLGACTGGFTEVLLDKGAKMVYCVDVGHGQLHERLRNHDRIVNIEKTHIRELTTTHVPDLVDGIVIDVSFISLEKVLPFTLSFLKPGGKIIALIKPQFELEKKFLNKNGVVKSANSYPVVIEKISRCAEDCNFHIEGITDSPISGGDGNKEFLMALIKK